MKKNKNNNKTVAQQQQHGQKEVQVRVIFLRVGDIDTLNEKFFADILVETKWEDPNLSCEFAPLPHGIIKNEYFCEEKELTNPNKYWNPKIYIENALNDPKQTAHYKIKKEHIRYKNVNNNDSTNTNKSTDSENDEQKFRYWLYEYKKIKGYFFEKLELNYFPVDVQDLSIIVTTFRSNKEVLLIQNTRKLSIVNSNLTIDQNIWHLYQHVEVKSNYDHDDFNEYEIQDNSNRNGNRLRNNYDVKRNSSIRFPMIMFQCRAARRSGYFYWNAYFLIFLITTSVFTTFSIDCEKPHFRLPTTATLLLTSITFRWSYSSRCLPTVNYLTSLDKYSISSLVLVYLCLIWHGFSGALSHAVSIKIMKSLDKFFLTFLALFYLTNHIILFIWLKSAYSIRKSMKERDNKLFKPETKSTDSLVSNDTMTGGDGDRDDLAFKRQSVFATINNIDAINAKKKNSRIRRFSIQFRSVISNLSLNNNTVSGNEMTDYKV